jgi:hypothetical protein
MIEDGLKVKLIAGGNQGKVCFVSRGSGLSTKTNRTMHLASPHKAEARFLLFSPSPLEGEGWDEGVFLMAKHPSPYPLPQGERVYFKLRQVHSSETL